MTPQFWLVLLIATVAGFGGAYLMLEFVVAAPRPRKQPTMAPPTATRRAIDPVRAAAYQALLELPADRRLAHRLGHRVTQAGGRDRFTSTWLPATRVWTEHRLAASAGVVEGWRPALTEGRQRRLIRVGR